VDIKDYFNTPFKTPESIPGLVTTFLNVIFVVSGVIILFYFIFGGIGLISSAGSDNAQQKEQAKKTITSALIGFIVVFTAYWIVKLIGLITGVTII
jgi:succinate dehydrogenase/fumarate reductase cytochrome b subunit